MKRVYIKGICLLAVLALPLITARAQTRSARQIQSAATIASKYKRALGRAAKDILTGVDAVDDSTAVSMSPYLYRMFGPGVYFRSALQDQLSMDGVGDTDTVTGTPVFRNRQAVSEAVDRSLLDAYSRGPQYFRYQDTQVASEQIVLHDDSAAAHQDPLSHIYKKVPGITDVATVVDDVDVDFHIEKPNFWTTKGKTELKFTQNYLSENWYKGGNNNVTMLSALELEAHYNDQKRLQWDNKLELRLGFLTAASDSVHKFITSEDRILLNSKLGVKAKRSWFYTISMEARTQFMPGHKNNDRRTYSRFLAPLDVFVSVGMDFKPAAKNGNSFSLVLLPLSYKIRYIGDEDENIHASYNMREKDFQQDFGSKVELNSNITIAKNLTWKCRFYYFTSYKYVESELENVFRFKFNKYISSELNTLWRFDDNRGKKYYDDNLGFFQFKEFFTLGLSYEF